MYGYHKVWRDSLRKFERHDIDMPPVELDTTGFWLSFQPDVAGLITSKGLDFAAGAHAASHAVSRM